MKVTLKTRYLPEAEYRIVVAEYMNGTPAWRVVDQNGEQLMIATVNMPDHPNVKGTVWIKSYSENEGLIEALEKANLIRRTGIEIHGGHVTIPLCEVLHPSLDPRMYSQ